MSGATTVGLAGCAAIPGFGEESTGSGPPFTDWLYAPSVVRREHYAVLSVAPSVVSRVRGLLRPPTYAAWRDRVADTDPAEIGMDKIDRHVRFDLGTVAATGDFSMGELGDALERWGFTARSTYEGYRLYVRSRTTDGGIGWEVVGARNGRYVMTRKARRYTGLLIAREVIDAAEGRNPRYDTEQATFRRVVEPVVSGAVVAAETTPTFTNPRVLPVDLEGIVGAGHGLVVDDETTRRRVTLAYEDDDAADESAVRSWIDVGTPIGGDMPTSDIELEREDRVFTLSWRQPLGSVEDELATAVDASLDR